MLDDLHRVLSDRSALPASLEEACQGVATRIEAIRREAAGWGAAAELDGQRHTLHQLSGNDGGNVITIFGDRGVGKTTTLYGVIADLLKSDETDDLVLPVVRPAHFAEQDSVFSWCLYFLLEHAKAGHLDRTGRQRADLEHEIANLQRLHALRELDHLTWTTADVVPERAAARLAALTALQPEVSSTWQRLVTALTSDGDQQRLLMVPIDDLDVGGRAVRELLEELHQIVVHPAVVVVACLHRPDVEAALTRFEIDRRPVSISDQESTRTHLAAEGAAHRAMTKLLPTNLRTELVPLSLGEAMSFRPMRDERTISDLLGQVPLAGLGDGWTLLDLFMVTVGEATHTTQFCSILPRLPRELEQIHAGIAGLIDGGEVHSRSVVSLLANAALTTAMHTVATKHRDKLPEVPADRDDNWRIDLSNYQIITRVGGGSSRPLPNRATAHFRGLRSYPVFFDLDDDVEAVPPQVEGLVHLLIESTHQDVLSPSLLDAHRLGSIAYPGGQNSNRHLEIQVGGEMTDSEFLLIPAWEGSYDYFLHLIGWDYIIRRLGRRTSKLGEQSNCDITFAVLAHTGLVASIAASRRLPEWLASDDVDIDALEDLEDPAVSWWVTEIKDLLREAFSMAYAESYNNQRNRDFVVWLVDHLMWATDATLCPANAAAWLVAARDEVIAAVPEVSREDVDRSAAAALSRRLRESLGSAWIAKPLDLLRAIDEPSWEQIKRIALFEEGGRPEERQALLAQLRRTALPPPLIDEIEVSGVTDSLRRRLAMFFPTESVDQIAVLFPGVIDSPRSFAHETGTPTVIEE